MILVQERALTPMSLSDFDIQAYLDNELDWERAKAVLAYIESDPQAKQRYEHLRAQKGLLRDWWQTEKRN